MQAAAAYDDAARQIRGENAICNFPKTEQEQENAERYLVRVGGSRKRRTDSAMGGPPANSQRRLTARQLARAASAPVPSVDEAEVRKPSAVLALQPSEPRTTNIAKWTEMLRQQLTSCSGHLTQQLLQRDSTVRLDPCCTL